MNNLRLLKLALVFTLLLLTTPRARAQEEARPVWQVTRFDVTATLPAPASTDRALIGRALISARNVGTGAGRSLTVRLNSAAEIKSATVGDATAQYFARAEARTGLQQVSLTLPAPVAPGSSINVALDYRLPVNANTGLAAVSPEGAQFLPLSGWYPTANSQFAARGA
ncbi:MAG: hypothetical protein QOG00_2391, partial [Pyrinomonadaceae bacterium]|nr:hypothetical protein [Pyrinomonadaceae bacterium]